MTQGIPQEDAARLALSEIRDRIYAQWEHRPFTDPRLIWQWMLDRASHAEATNAELLRLLERHHKESLARDILLPEDAEHYSGTELYWATVGATRPAEAAIKRAKEKV